MVASSLHSDPPSLDWMSFSSVAICIPTFNQAVYLEEAVGSALAQTHPCEVWVSDDASTDETPEVMARLLRKYPQIKHVRHKQNLGMSGNPRWIVQQPDTEYIVKLDSDDELHSNYVEKLLQALQANPSAGYAHASVQEIDDQGRKQKKRFLARNAGCQNAEDSLRTSVSGYRVAANICMFRRVALQRVDYYRNNLSFADDWDLAVRLADAGWGNVYVNEVLASYRVWNTPVRSRRKLAEVEGCRRVIEDSLVPAFSRRNWDLKPISKSRRQLALRHAEALGSNQFAELERSELKEALCRLGDSCALRWKFYWINTPLAPPFQVPANILAKAKAWYKTVIFSRPL
jgi:cellulose synthase/poly-beta-1,6-N-acetylglucosamine synthase-like glycosyltransferase